MPSATNTMMFANHSPLTLAVVFVTRRWVTREKTLNARIATRGLSETELRVAGGNRPSRL
jgi:hypothetical protein